MMSPESSSKAPMLLGAVFAGLVLCYLVFTHLGNFADLSFLGGLLFLQIMLVGLVHYDRVFFPFVMIAFLWAGLSIPMQGVWTQARWPVLAIGAVAGIIKWMKRRHAPFRLFHIVAVLCVCAAVVSAIVSAIPQLALSKAASFFLLLLYGAGGVRLAVLGREDRFFAGLLQAAEIMAYAAGILYLVLGFHIFGNPNSLGQVMSIGLVPVLMWGWHTTEPGFARTRRLLALLIALYLVYSSNSRAALLAVGISTLAFCFGLRQYKILVRGLAFAVCLIAVTGVVAPSSLDDSVAELTDAVLYKGHREAGLLGSRQTPWEETVSEIKVHPFFGSGFGTSPTQEDASRYAARFSSTAETNREHGSSYMEIAEWVGMLGLVPFVALLALVLVQILKALDLLRRTGNDHAYSIPIALILLAALVHATFEDWLFAAGSYSCVFFWSLAFVLVDLLPASVRARSAAPSRQRFGRPLAVAWRGQ